MLTKRKQETKTSQIMKFLPAAVTLLALLLSHVDDAAAKKVRGETKRLAVLGVDDNVRRLKKAKKVKCPKESQTCINGDPDNCPDQGQLSYIGECSCIAEGDGPDAGLAVACPENGRGGIGVIRDTACFTGCSENGSSEGTADVVIRIVYN